MLPYRRMPCNIYINTMFCPKIPCVSGCMMAPIFATNFGWSQFYPMKCKGEAHEALSLLSEQEGVPPKVIIVGMKEMKLGEFA